LGLRTVDRRIKTSGGRGHSFITRSSAPGATLMQWRAPVSATILSVPPLFLTTSASFGDRPERLEKRAFPLFLLFFTGK
jgi:hypothetical protein